ncbi:MAG: tyrosine--tRNA ligase [bacterium]|nr:tyrosine--tRNA ligase [bacterium]
MDKIEELLTRGVEKIYPAKEVLEKVLRSGKKLKLYQGFDPTGTQLHLGHMVGFRKLRQWQDLGHHVIFLIGDGTGQAGDPSGKTTGRGKFFTQEELRQNAKDYVMQAKKVVRFEGENPVEILYNGDWLNKLTLPEILDIAGHFTLQQLSERDLFVEREKKGIPVNFREFLYPVLQGYDSVAMSVDLELGGNDQTFNMLCGRTLVKAMQGREKFVMTTPLLTDSQGNKIGKTEGNVISLTDIPDDLYAKIMALGDDVIIKGFEYLTDIPTNEIDEIKVKLSKDDNPIVYKKRLAFEVVKQLNNEEKAKKAQEEFEKRVQQKEVPKDIQVYLYTGGELSVVNLLTQMNLADSKSEAKRLIEQGGVSIDNELIKDSNKIISPENGSIIRVGKRKYVKIKTS